MRWTHKKFGTKSFYSSYEREKDGERVFVLTYGATGPQFKNYRKITFESWQAAKKAGWKKES